MKAGHHYFTGLYQRWREESFALWAEWPWHLIQSHASFLRPKWHLKRVEFVPGSHLNGHIMLVASSSNSLWLSLWAAGMFANNLTVTVRILDCNMCTCMNMVFMLG